MTVPEMELVSIRNTAALRCYWVLMSPAIQMSMLAFIVVLNLSVLAEAAPRSSGSQPSTSKPQQYTKMLPTSEDDCRAISMTAGTIVSQREKGMSPQRQRDLWSQGFARDDATSASPVFSHFQRATIFTWLLDDLYRPSAFLSNQDVRYASDIWCRTALITSHQKRIPFTLSLFTPDLLYAINSCTDHYDLGPTLVRLRNHGLPLADAMAILRVGIQQGFSIGQRSIINLREYSSREFMERTSLEFIERARHSIDENTRVLQYVATAIYADVSLSERVTKEQVSRLCLEVWIP